MQTFVAWTPNNENHRHLNVKYRRFVERACNLKSKEWPQLILPPLKNRKLIKSESAMNLINQPTYASESEKVRHHKK